MNDPELMELITDCVNGDISSERHESLQEKLRSDAQARATFREFMDLESGLRTWASESASSRLGVESARRESVGRRWPALLATAASLAMLSVAAWLWLVRPSPSPEITERSSETTAVLGTVLQQKGCVWRSSRGTTAGGRFSQGNLSLVSGVAQLQFDSGTDLVLRGPCELKVVSADSANLLAGNVVVRVSELSDGFTLRTPDATIIDEGTEYGVLLDNEATEVHVFEGSVFWQPLTEPDDNAIERIPAGEARRYPRSRPRQGSGIPLGKRRFIRRLEAEVRQQSGAGLLAYDGFENLAGRIRRGRSGFGWEGGWQTGGRGPRRAGTIVDAPADTPFGVSREGRRLLQLSSGEAIGRDLVQPLSLDAGDVYYMSFILQPRRGSNGAGRFFQASLCASDRHPRRRSRNELAFGVTSDGFPFIKSGRRIIQSAPSIEAGTVYLFVAKILVSHGNAGTYLRLYRDGESIDYHEPAAWSTVGRPSRSGFNLSWIRLAAGDDAVFDIDELRIGTTWHSVTAYAADTPSGPQKPGPDF